MEYQEGIEKGIKGFLKARGITLDKKEFSIRWLDDSTDEGYTRLITWKPQKEIPEIAWKVIDECEDPPLARIQLMIKRTTEIENQVGDLIELMNRVRYGAFKETHYHGPDSMWEDQIKLDNKFDMTSCWHYTQLSWWQFGDPFAGYKVEMLIGICTCS